MFKLGFILLLCSLSFGTPRRLILVGGGDIPRSAIDHALKWVSSEEPIVMPICWATSDPTYAHARLARLFPHSSKILSAPDAVAIKDPAQKAQFLDQLKTADIVFFSGGDQTRIAHVARDEDIYRALHQAYSEGKIIMGTSAGTAIMNDRMPASDEPQGTEGMPYDLQKGLSFLPSDFFLEQHFPTEDNSEGRVYRRGRLERILKITSRKYGIGIVQSSAVAIEASGGNQWRILNLGEYPIPIYQKKTPFQVEKKLLAVYESLILSLQ